MKSFEEFDINTDLITQNADFSSSELLRLGVGYIMFNVSRGKPFSEEEISNFLDACRSLSSLAELVDGAAHGDYALGYDHDENIFVIGHPSGEIDLSDLEVEMPTDKDGDTAIIAHIAIESAAHLLEGKILRADYD